MPQLELKMINATAKDLQATGAIYSSPISEDAHPRVSHVFARLTTSAWMNLPPGAYAYLFQVDSGDGKFQLVIKDHDTGKIYGDREFDTSISHFGRVLRFEVTP